MIKNRARALSNISTVDRAMEIKSQELGTTNPAFENNLTPGPRSRTTTMQSNISNRSTGSTTLKPFDAVFLERTHFCTINLYGNCSVRKLI